MITLIFIFNFGYLCSHFAVLDDFSKYFLYF